MFIIWRLYIYFIVIGYALRRNNSEIMKSASREKSAKTMEWGEKGIYILSTHLSLPADKKFSRSNWLCRCGEKEKEAHITSGSCPIYDDIWEKRGDLENNDDLVKFFSAVLERRDLLDRLEEEERDAPSLGNWDS